MSQISKRFPIQVKVLIFSFFCSNFGTYLVVPIMAIYMSHQLGFDGVDIAMVLSVYFCTGRLTPAVIGALADKFGYYRFIGVGLPMRGIGFILFPFADVPSDACLSAALIGLGGCLFETPAFGLLQTLKAEVRQAAIVFVNMALNLGVIVGPLLGVVVSVYSISLAFQVSGLIFIFSSIFVLGNDRLGYSLPGNRPLFTIFLVPLRDIEFVKVLASMFLWFVLFAQMFFSLPVSISQIAGDASWANAVFIVNGVVGVLVLGLLSRKLPVAKGNVILVCFLVAGFSFLLLYSSKSLVVFILALAVFSLAEVVILPYAQILISRLASEDNGGAYFGLYNMVFGCGIALGNFLGGRVSPSTNDSAIWLLMLLISITGACFSLVLFSRRPFSVRSIL